MSQELSNLDRELMIMQIMMNSRFAENALLKMSDTELVDLYKVKVLRDEYKT